MDSTRRFVKDVKRVIIKVGTVVATRSNGRLAVGTLACLCEQVEELNSRGYELILVNGSCEDLQKPELESDGKAQAVVGQNELIGLYDTLFTQLDLASSNLLVTEKDFDDPSFRRQLSETVNSLLARKVIPILNENDALSTRRAPYEDSWGILRDNDNLVGLLAMELKADLLILLGDEEGLYGGPPTDPRSKIIHTYIAKIHESQVARGDMAAKVNAVVCVASAGTPVVISSAFASAGILKVLEGEKIGTLFHRDAEKLVAMKKSGAREMAVSARECSRRFQNLTLEEWKKVMLNVANALEENEKLIMAENEADVKVAKLHGYGKTFLSRLTLKPGEISRSAKYIRDMKTPIESLIKYTKISDGLVLKETTSPSGVLLAVFESCPGDLVLYASQVLFTRDGLLLKGGKEAAKSNAILHKVITEAIPETIGKELIGLVTSKEEILDLLKLDDVIDLVIPRGSSELVSKIKETTKIPARIRYDGICHVYIDKSANMENAKRVVLESKIDYPAGCYAVETLLVHKDIVESREFNDLIAALKLEGVIIYGGPRAGTELGIPEAKTFLQEYNHWDCTVEIVDDVTAAINHILNHGSSQADCIIAEDHQVVQLFLKSVKSPVMIYNALSHSRVVPSFEIVMQAAISPGSIHARRPLRRCLRGHG